MDTKEYLEGEMLKGISNAEGIVLNVFGAISQFLVSGYIHINDVNADDISEETAKEIGGILGSMVRNSTVYIPSKYRSISELIDLVEPLIRACRTIMDNHIEADGILSDTL